MSKPRSMRIRVSEEDIRHGSRAECRLCPVARALRRNGFYGAFVENHGFWTGGRKLVGDFVGFSRRVAQHIRVFDHAGKMKPFSFMVRAEP